MDHHTEMIARRRAKIFAATTTKTLLSSALSLDGIKMDAHERVSYAWICEEIERRVPEIEPYVEAVFESEESEPRTYAEILRDALAAL